ncbi:MAG: T9SS type A sorting domain-containing protein [Bacteroidia bacterium]
MKQIPTILIFILCFGNHLTKAQNLVSNGYFEMHDTCPNNYSKINYATGWINAASYTTPDYFNTCSNINSICYIPNTVYGYQKDGFSGNAFAGIYTYEFPAPNNGNEYIQTRLIDSLKVGKKYIASFYVNQCNNYNYAIAGIGMYFTNAPIQAPNGVGLFNIQNPQVKNRKLLNDTLNWLLVQDTLNGTSLNQYLTIGNFSPDSTSDTTKVYDNSNLNYSYYYIDGVSVYEIDGSCNSYWDAGVSKYIAAGDSIRLGGINTDYSSYTWQNSLGGLTYLSSNTDARPWSKPTQTTTYYVTKTCPNNNIFTDTVTVYVYIKPKANLNRDSVYCGNLTLPMVLDAGVGQGYTYHWSTGATTQTISVSSSGTYTVNVMSSTASLLETAPYSSTIDSISLLFVNTSNPNILHDTALCSTSNFPIVLNAAIPIAPHTNNSYTWTGGHVGAQLTVNSPGTYIATVWIKNSLTNALECKIIDTARVTIGCMDIQQFMDKGESINLYPNPNNGTMNIDYSVKEDASLEIMDITGKLVVTYNMPATGTNIQIKNNYLQNGMYLYRVISNDKLIKIGKFVVMQ